jgi:DNA-binding NtrC family response regulator
MPRNTAPAQRAGPGEAAGDIPSPKSYAANMGDAPSQGPSDRSAWSIVASAFAALGRGFLCADAGFRVVHASKTIDQLVGEGASDRAEGRPLEDVLGRELFAPSGALRQTLASGQRREGWRAHLQVEGFAPRLVSLSAAPFVPDPRSGCDPRVRYIVVVRPAEDDLSAGLSAPTAVGGFIARSPAMVRIFALVENLAQSDATVLISGESGTGKEVLARAIHSQSLRSKGPFVAVNCGALPAGLLESEMFGHAQGAFTGAARARVGRFEAASDGTLFLDEVGDLPLELQVKLLRVLQDGTFERLGENHTRTSHARLIAATHVNLAEAVRAGRFREDLFYRLRVVPIEIPPLRQRREDLEPLALAILSRVSARQGRALRFSPDALRALLHHDWPGNVREMENVLEYAVAVCRGQTILPEDLGSLGAAAVRAPAAGCPSGVTPGPGLRAVARPATGRVVHEAPPAEELRQVLDRNRWQRSGAARELGVSRTTLWRWMRERHIA